MAVIHFWAVYGSRVLGRFTACKGYFKVKFLSIVRFLTDACLHELLTDACVSGSEILTDSCLVCLRELLTDLCVSE